MEAQELRKTLEELERKYSTTSAHQPSHVGRDQKLPAIHGTTIDQCDLLTEHVETWIKKNSRGKIFLDYACGSGRHAIHAAQMGAALAIGIDNSRTSLENAREQAKKFSFSNEVYFIEGDCENTGLPGESIDTILCSELLRFVDLSFTMPELRRILKPGGKILCIEDIAYNPAIKFLCRSKQPSFKIPDLKFAERFFDVKNVRFWNLLSQSSAAIKVDVLKKPLTKALNKIDNVLVRVPGVQLMAGQMSFELRKPR